MTSTHGHGDALRMEQSHVEWAGPLARADAEDLAELFQALADPTRVRIIALLAAREMAVGDVANELGMTISAISHQLRLLRRMRLVRVRRDGRHVYYALDDEHIEVLFRCGVDHLAHR